MQSPGSIANRFQPGNKLGTGPRRRPMDKLLDEVAQQFELLGKKIPHGMTVERYFIESMYRHAIGGRAAFAQIICDRRWGLIKPADDMVPEDVRAALANMALDRVIADQMRRAAEGKTQPEPGA